MSTTSDLFELLENIGDVLAIQRSGNRKRKGKRRKKWDVEKGTN